MAVNKNKNEEFSATDSEHFTSFCEFCSLVISNCQSLKELTRSRMKCKVRNCRSPNTCGRVDLSTVGNQRGAWIPLHLQRRRLSRGEEQARYWCWWLPSQRVRGYGCWSFPIQVSAYHLCRFSFDSSVHDASTKAQLAVTMFSDLVETMDCFEMDKLLRFCLTVSKNYRPVSYHNWEHAFSVAHCMHWVLKGAPHMFSEIEVNHCITSYSEVD